MELKKSKKADLERKKGIFFQVGILVALLVVFLAFEYVGAREKSVLYRLMGGEIIPEVVEIVLHPGAPPPPPVPVYGELKPVENDEPTNDPPVFDPTEGWPNYPSYTEDTVEIEPPHDPSRDVIVDIPDINPGFIGGEEARLKFLQDNVKYPRSAIEMRIEGKVVVSFVVERDGSISDVKISRSVAQSLDEEAIRVAKLMPKWQPGLQKGKAVRARFNMPITFTLKGN